MQIKNNEWKILIGHKIIIFITELKDKYNNKFNNKNINSKINKLFEFKKNKIFINIT